MRFLIITHVLHKSQNKHWFAYAPYVREMNLWLKYVDEVEIVAPKTNQPITDIDIVYQHEKIILTEIPSIAFVTFGRTLLSLLSLPFILYKLYQACRRADHIHLRCPGNIGLLGCLVQMLFPQKIKTAKYAGNWDPHAVQPLSYRIQKKLLSNTSLTKNMTALVYGHWNNQTKNIKPFYTATFNNEDREDINLRDYSGHLHFVFVGSLVKGKRPLLAIQIVESLKQKGYSVALDIYGDGILKEELQDYITKNNLSTCFRLHGNQTRDTIKTALQSAHFILLASQSEGWPKALAEAMFFGVIPIATSISCVPDMLDYGKRGILIEPHVTDAVRKIEAVLNNMEQLSKMSKNALQWSQQYTLDVFEEDIKKLIEKGSTHSKNNDE
ncbi:glycosyltransferase family 4 protein [Olleya aquimaris]|uniref:Glycosyltransferase involved in cell wall biosynthesis n=1 Tax=Olleya aquimaris TaxID=639310 RepID=A0A327RKR2_9FLAO|nr:glycosyltransferase family 4 protein [Olleya aquimaris]RAJ17001.1 glycosyltransferase involved in cell wall biosynthesis [Olleya aquimaris]